MDQEVGRDDTERLRVMSPKAQVPKTAPAQKKSHTALIITLLCVFVVAPILLGSTALLLVPSIRLCSSIARTGNEVSALFESNLKVSTYRYTCLTSTPPTAKDQNVSIGLTSARTYSSREEFQSVISANLTSGGWSPVATTDESTVSDDSVMFSKNGYTAKIAVHTYQPAYGKITIKSDSPQINFGFVFKKSPNVPSYLSDTEALKFVTVPVYVSEYVPEGYSSWLIKTNTTSRIESYAILNGGKGAVTPRLAVTAIPANYDISAQRKQLVNTQGGVIIYAATENATRGRYDLVAIIGSNLVTLEYGYQHPNVNPQLTTEQVSAVFDSLKQTNTPAK